MSPEMFQFVDTGDQHSPHLIPLQAKLMFSDDKNQTQSPHGRLMVSQANQATFDSASPEGINVIRQRDLVTPQTGQSI
jgi:hypothetical protein